MLLSSEDSIRTELGLLLSSGPSTCLNSNKLFLFSIIMMRKTAGAGKCAFEMIFLRLQVAHHQKYLAQPYFTIWRRFLHRCYVDKGSLINKKKLKNSLGLLIFCGGCADLMPFSTNLCKKKHFYQELRDLGAFYFVSSTAI